MPYVRVIFSIPQTLYEPVIAKCLLLGMQGNEEDAQGDRVMFKVYFVDKTVAESAAFELRKIDDLSIAAVEPVAEEDWLARWRESMKPVWLANGFWVSPLWLPPPESAKHWIKIEPKMAFGTGHHETTRLAAVAIIANGRKTKINRFLDIGTGSGILCFTADACGAFFCLGIEIDAQCRANLAENHRDNVVHNRIAFSIGSIATLKVQAHFDLVVMNMLITESAHLLGAVANLLPQRGRLIWSGILIDEAEKAIERARNVGVTLVNGRRGKEWWCGTFEKFMDNLKRDAPTVSP